MRTRLVGLALLFDLLTAPITVPLGMYVSACPTEDATTTRYGTPGCVWWAAWEGNRDGRTRIGWPGATD